MTSDSRPHPADEPEPEGWHLVAQLARRIAGDDAAAIDELAGLVAGGDLTPKEAELASTIHLMLGRLEGREFLLEVAHDLEDRLRELEELKEANYLITAQDLLHPIGALRGLAKLLAMDQVPEDQRRDVLNRIVRVSDQMLRLIETPMAPAESD